jgi:predicted HTH domain antitoxin
MAELKLEIPEDVLRSLKLPPAETEAELCKELALALYQRGVLSMGKARVLARLSRWEFHELLGQRRIPRHYTEEDLEEDLRYGLGNQ